MNAPAPGFAAIALLMFVSGMGIPVMAALNAGLGSHLQSPVAAGTVLFGLGFVLAGIVLVAVGPPPRAAFVATPPIYFFGALFVVFYILAITWAAPRIGVGNAVFLVLLGQLIAAAAIDHVGAFGALPTPLTTRRFAGLLVMACGVYLARKPR